MYFLTTLTPTYIIEVERIVIYMNENIQLLIDGKNAFPEIISCIKNAKQSVVINMFIWRDDNIGNQMAEAVLYAANNGVKVIISKDRYGVVLEKSEECKRSFFHKTQTLKEKLSIYTLEMTYPKNGKPEQVKDEYTPLYKKIINHPNIELQADKFKADHSKWYVIDDEILFVGGINIEDKENGCDINGNVYGDYMVKLEGKKYVEMFYHKLKTGLNKSEALFFGINQKEPKKHFEMEQLYLDLINNAKSHLHITMAYFSPLNNFTQAIISAHQRGVKVTIVIPEHANFQDASNRRNVSYLLKATNGEIEIYFSPKMLHTKLVMNEQYISLGSTNITKKAFNQLDELNLFIKNDDSTISQELKASIQKDIQSSKRITNYKEIKYNFLLAFAEGFIV